MINKTTDQAKDTGMAMVLILLLVAYFWEVPALLGWAILVLLIDMIWPPVFAPLARVWFGLSHVMGTVASKVLLTLVFVLVTMPIGLLRRLLGIDTMKRKIWKKGTDSVLTERDHRYVAGDLEKPY